MGFVVLEVTTWIQADDMDWDTIQHVVDDFMNILCPFTIQTEVVLFLFFILSSVIVVFFFFKPPNCYVTFFLDCIARF